MRQCRTQTRQRRTTTGLEIHRALALSFALVCSIGTYTSMSLGLWHAAEHRPDAGRRVRLASLVGITHDGQLAREALEVAEGFRSSVTEFKRASRRWTKPTKMRPIAFFVRF